MKFSANLSFLFTEVPFLERFERAAAAGFEAVEFMFPYDYAVEDLRRLLSRYELRQDLFNLPAGDFAAGERGVAVQPDRRDEFRRGVEEARSRAEILGCRKLNCLVGVQIPGLAWDTQYECLLENLNWGAERLGTSGLTLHIELLNPVETPGFFLESVSLVRRILEEATATNLKFQCDVYHLQRTQGELVPTIRMLAPHIGHIQIADAPDRHEPGTGEIHFPYLLQEIESSGYDGYVGLEYHPSGSTEDSFGWLSTYRDAEPKEAS